MPAPQVIATDLDGTLLGPGRLFTDRTRAALQAARERGVAVVAVTARPPRVFDEWTVLASALDAAICANGAMTYDPAERAVRAMRTLHPEAAALAAKTLRQALPRVRFAVETGFEVIAEADYRRVDSVGDRRRYCETLTEALAAAPQIVKLLVHDPEGHADAVLAAARALDLPGVALSHSGGNGLVEVSATGVDKASALADWCAGRGVGPEGVVAFGDAPNDVPMLAWAGRSFAVANAHPEAVAAASDRCGSNADDGVATVVEALLRA
jgi:Cof subfamily protein (haloacid dehalogenase superfamily)